MLCTATRVNNSDAERARLTKLFIIEYVLETGHRFADSPLLIISEQISECSECMQLFHENRNLVPSKSGILENWNIERQSTILAESITAYNVTTKAEGSTSSYKTWRSKIILIIFELLNFPNSLKHNTIGISPYFVSCYLATSFIQLLKLAQVKSKLKLNETERIYPGLILLAFNEDGKLFFNSLTL